MRISDWSSDVCSSDLDVDALGRIGIASALAAAAFLGRAGLVVEQHADARRVAQLLLHAIEMVAVLDGDPGGPGGAGGILLRIVAHHRSEEHTSELQSLMRTSYAVFCLKKKKEHT